MVTSIRLDVLPDPDVWFIGPDERRGFDEWLPQAVELLRKSFGVKRRQRDVVEFLTLMLARLGRPSESPLPYRLIRWLRLEDVPFVASFGVVPREIAEDGMDDFLAVTDGDPVEAPVIEEVSAPTGTSIRRSITYGRDEIQPESLLIEVRYVVDTGLPDAVAMVHAGAVSPGELMGVLRDLDDFARVIRITSED